MNAALPSISIRPLPVARSACAPAANDTPFATAVGAASARP